MKVKLAYIVESNDGVYESGLESFNTKKAAQIYDRFLKEHYGETIVHSNIIYDEDIKDYTHIVTSVGNE